MNRLRIIGLLWLMLLAANIRAEVYDTNNVTVTTLVGSAFTGYLDGTGQLTKLSAPTQIAADAAGNLYFWDSGNHLIRKIDTSAVVTTWAGGGTGGIPGTGTNVNLSSFLIDSLFMGPANTMYAVTSASSLIYKISGAAAITTIAVTNLSGASGLCWDSAGNLYFGGGNKIYRVFTTGQQEVFVGDGASGAIDGNGVFTSFNGPGQLVCDGADNLYVWDSGNDKIRKITQNRDVTTFETSGTLQDGTDPHFSAISHMAIDSAGNIYCASGTCIRKLTLNNTATTEAGTLNIVGYTNGPGNLARFASANGFCLSLGSIFVADSGNNRIRQISFNAVTNAVTPANLSLNLTPSLSLTGIIGRTYQIQSSTDLNTWTTIASIIPISIPYLWLDPNPANGKKYYRANLLP